MDAEGFRKDLERVDRSAAEAARARKVAELELKMEQDKVEAAASRVGDEGAKLREEVSAAAAETATAEARAKAAEAAAALSASALVQASSAVAKAEGDAASLREQLKERAAATAAAQTASAEARAATAAAQTVAARARQQAEDANASRDEALRGLEAAHQAAAAEMGQLRAEKERDDQQLAALRTELDRLRRVEEGVPLQTEVDIERGKLEDKVRSLEAVIASLREEAESAATVEGAALSSPIIRDMRDQRHAERMRELDEEIQGLRSELAAARQATTAAAETEATAVAEPQDEPADEPAAEPAAADEHGTAAAGDGEASSAELSKLAALEEQIRSTAARQKAAEEARQVERLRDAEQERERVRERKRVREADRTTIRELERRCAELAKAKDAALRQVAKMEGAEKQHAQELQTLQRAYDAMKTQNAELLSEVQARSGGYCKIVILSPICLLSVSLIQEVSLFQMTSWSGGLCRLRWPGTRRWRSSRRCESRRRRMRSA